MTGMDDRRDEDAARKVKEVSGHIKELSDKSTQLLIFLSFALAVAAAVGSYTSLIPAKAAALARAMHWWICAVYPVMCLHLLRCTSILPRHIADQFGYLILVGILCQILTFMVRPPDD